MLNIPITEIDTVCTINSMYNNNSSGLMKSPLSYEKSCAQYLSKPLAYIYNTPISQGKFPDRLKH